LPTLLDNDPEALAKLKQQSLISGLLGAGATYLAQPKNQRYGSALPYIGKAFLGGMQSSQGVYDQATKDYIMNQQIQDMKDKQAENAAWKSIQDKLVTTTPAVTAQVPVSGGNAPSTEQVAPEVQAPVPSLLTSQPTEQPQVPQTPDLLSNPPVENAPVTTPSAPNYNVVKQPDVMQTQVVTPEQTAFNKDLLTKFVLQHPTNESAKAVLSNMEALKKLNAPEKGFRLLTIEEKQSRGLPLESQFQIGADNKVELVSGTEQKKPELVQLQESQDRLVKNNTAGQNDKRIAEIQNEIDHKTGKDSDPPVKLTPEAKEMNARVFLKTGVMPVFGMGKNASNARDEIYNMSTKIGLDMGMSPEQVAQQIADSKVTYNATKNSYNRLSTQEGLVNAFEKTASLNADQALKLSNKVDRLGIPIVEAWKQNLQSGKGIVNNPTLAQFRVANDTFLTEYAKVMSGQTSGAAVSDYKIKATNDLLAKSYDKESYAAAVAQMKIDMANRREGFTQEKQVILSGGNQSNQPATIAEGTVSKSNSGKPIIFKNGKWEYR
jgi:hypothetical protein